MFYGLGCAAEDGVSASGKPMPILVCQAIQPAKPLLLAKCALLRRGSLATPCRKASTARSQVVNRLLGLVCKELTDDENVLLVERRTARVMYGRNSKRGLRDFTRCQSNENTFASAKAVQGHWESTCSYRAT